MQQYPGNQQPQQQYPYAQQQTSSPPMQPYPYGMLPPQQPPKKKRRRWPWIVGIVLVLVVVVAVANAGNGNQPSSPASTPTTGAQSQATNAPTQASQPTSAVKPTQKPTQPAPTATHPVVVNGPALLGANIGTFTAHYGTPDSHTDASIGSYHYQKYGDSNIDFLIVWTDQTDGSVYAQRVQNVNVQADTGGWSITQAYARCAVFYPADAVYKKQIPVANGPALDKIYYSASLAKLFPASAFTDASGNTVKAGYFDVQFLYRDSSEALVDSCSIQIGEQQTT